MHPNTQIDLNAIAKGWGVDHLFSLVRSFGYSNYMVEIGGEVKVSGTNIQKKPWKIGVDYPLPNTNPGEKILGIFSLIDLSSTCSKYCTGTQEPTNITDRGSQLFQTL